MGNYIVVDVETTGLDPRKCSLVSIGAKKRSNGDEFYGECRVWPGAEINESALKVNGFNYQDITGDEKIPEKTLIHQFFEWVGPSAILIGMNPYFDYSFLSAAALRAGIEKIPFNHRTLDMHTLAVSYAVKIGAKVPEKGFYTDAIYKLLNMAPEPQPHNALTGARMEDKAFHKLFYAVVR
jgi:DNA polymerase III epsilon subunit-like protein